jgi:maltooligosyltrehalose synthase
VAFARRHGSDIAITAVPRLVHALLGNRNRITFDSSVWKSTALKLDGSWPVVWRNIFDDQEIRLADRKIAAKSVFSRCPVALLIASR